MRSHFRTLVLASIALLCACKDSPAPDVVRAEVAAARAKSSAREDMLRERSGYEAVFSDTRDAWTIPVGDSVTFELGRYDAPDFTTATGVVVELDGPRTGVVECSIEVEGPVELSAKSEHDLASPRATWAESRSTVRPPAASCRVTLSARWIGDPPARAELVRAAFEIPRGARAAATARKGAPKVLVITVDTLRPDRLGCYGYARSTSPRIDALAAGGTRFASAYSSAPWTLPSYGSLFTGLYPGEHRAGVTTEVDALFGQDVDAPKMTPEHLRADVRTLAERFADAGYATAMFHNNPYLTRATGLERGFERYVAYGSNARNGVDAALAWIDSRGDAAWFGVLHLMDPHFPYAPPAPFDERFAGSSVDALGEWPPNLKSLRAGRPSDELAKLSSDLYDGEIAFTDEQIGRLLDALRERGLLEETIVVLHSDHGEEFWEHGSCDHGHTQNEELLRVPVVVSWPGRVPAGRVVDARVRALDLYATLLELAGLEAPTGVESRSLVPLFTAAGEPRQAIAEAVHGEMREIKAVFDGAIKLVQRGTDVRLYDLSADLAETTDAPELEGCRAILLEHRRVSREAAKRARALELDAATREQMDKLGYTGHGGASRKDPEREE